MCNCKRLSSLPRNFGELSCLKVFNLLECKGLVKLTIGFSKLGCFEELYLSRCSWLQELCGDFDCLQSLKRLNLSHFKRLDGIWMDCVGNNENLVWVDIQGIQMMIQWWMEMQSNKVEEEWPFPLLGREIQTQGDTKARKWPFPIRVS